MSEKEEPESGVDGLISAYCTMRDRVAELEQQVEAARREGFEAGRKQIKLNYGEDWPTLWPFVFPTYADYAKSREGE